MVKTEILPCCSRVISAASDTTHLPGWTLRCAPCSFIAESLHHDLQFASHDVELNDNSHSTYLVPPLAGQKPGSPGLFPEVGHAPAHQVVGAGACLRLHVLKPDALTGLIVDPRKLHRVSGLSIDKSEWRPRIAGNGPLVAHLQQCLQHEDGVPALRGQNILISLGIGLVLAPLDQFVVLKVS